MEESLSERERAVVLLCAFGFRHRDIAAALYISVRTVDMHIARACDKLCARNGAHAAIIALWRGYLSLRDISECETARTPNQEALVNQEA